MYDFNTLDDHDLALKQTALVRALDFLAAKFEEHPKGIPLTKTGSFQRALIAEALERIRWPGSTEAEVYHGVCPVRVADERHFPPFRRLHSDMLKLGLARHVKGHLRLTRDGQSLFENRFARFDLMAQFALFGDTEYLFSRRHYKVPGNWDHWLNMIDVEAFHGASGAQLTAAIYDDEEPVSEFDRRTDGLYDGILVPLMYCGLLEEHRDHGPKLVQRVYRTTLLWKRYLKLDGKQPLLRVVS
jgi:hypothetical protein